MHTLCIKSRPGFPAVRHFTTWGSSPRRLHVYHTTGIRREQPPGGVEEIAPAVSGSNRITKTCFCDYITFFQAKQISYVLFRVVFFLISKTYPKPLRVTINPRGELVFFLSARRGFSYSSMLRPSLYWSSGLVVINPASQVPRARTGPHPSF